MGAEHTHQGAAGHEGHSVRIHIDQKPYESPNPTTGTALYRLGHVRPGWKLLLLLVVYTHSKLFFTRILILQNALFEVTL